MENPMIKPAGYGKRILSYLLDVVFVSVVSMFIWGFATGTTMFDACGGTKAVENYNDFLADSGLTDYAVADGQVSSVGVLSYDSVASDSSGSSAYGYQRYLHAVYEYYTVFLPNGRLAGGAAHYPIDSVTTAYGDVSASAYYTPVYFFTKILDLPSPAGIADYSVEANYSGTYFKYVLTGGVADLTQEPVLTSKCQTLVDSNLVMVVSNASQYATTVLADYFANSSTGIYTAACANLSAQSYYTNNYAIYGNAIYYSLVETIFPSIVLFFFLIPLFFKNGQTLGKLITGEAVVGSDGYQASFWIRMLHNGIITAIWLLVLLPLNNFSVTILISMALMLFDYMALIVSKTHQSFSDRISMTLVIDSRKSIWFADKQAEKEYALRHPTSFRAETPEDKVHRDSENRAIEQSEEVLDMSTIDRSREEAAAMTSFDEFEVSKEKELALRKAEDAAKLGLIAAAAPEASKETPVGQAKEETPAKAAEPLPTQPSTAPKADEPVSDFADAKTEEPTKKE